MGSESTLTEWLVTDRRGAFAMGNVKATRARKYHGFYLGVAGRSETAYLVDLEIEVNGKALWPHCYSSPDGPVLYPDPDTAPFQFQRQPWPNWRWDFSTEWGGSLVFSVEAGRLGGICLRWSFQGAKNAEPLSLRIRPFWAMRDLHGMGGQPWVWDATMAKVESPDGREIRCRLMGGLQWRESELWYHRFHYQEELARGYLAEEDLFSAGEFVARLSPGSSCALVMADDAQVLGQDFSEAHMARPVAPLLDFVLKEPAGIVAGYPWFGEWGRDTFISLPGVVAGWLEAGGHPDEVGDWVHELLSRWGDWIARVGMLPNLIEKEGSHQWDSADATLWWCHSLAALWGMSLAAVGNEKYRSYAFLSHVRERYAGTLEEAIESILQGRHRFLRVASDGLLEVTEGHTTWMDARVEGAAVTPRVGKLPEINALWFQARCLHALWSEEGNGISDLEAIGRGAFDCGEYERPNRVFLHSLPLAPTFVLPFLSAGIRGLNDLKVWKADMASITEKFWTPVGLKTLNPMLPEFKPHCVGSQEERDCAYHQGSVWGWLGGHYEMANDRMNLATREARQGSQPRESSLETFSSGILNQMPIEGHIPEIFDAQAPFVPRGAPAQAWSLACMEEARVRRRLGLDAKLTDILAKRWAGRGERLERKKRQDQGEVGI